jgi:hypothetical protein
MVSLARTFLASKDLAPRIEVSIEEPVKYGAQHEHSVIPDLGYTGGRSAVRSSQSRALAVAPSTIRSFRRQRSEICEMLQPEPAAHGVRWWILFARRCPGVRRSRRTPREARATLLGGSVCWRPGLAVHSRARPFTCGFLVGSRTLPRAGAPPWRAGALARRGRLPRRLGGGGLGRVLARRLGALRG